MSKYKRRTVLLLALAMGAFLAWLLYSAMQPPVLPIGAEMPAMAIETCAGNDSLRLESGDGQAEKKSGALATLVMLFSTQCPHCLYELDLFEKNLTRLSNIRLFLLTPEKEFKPCEVDPRWMKLALAENVTWARVAESAFGRSFGAAISPSLFFFDNSGILRKKIRGEAKFDKILECCQNRF